MWRRIPVCLGLSSSQLIVEADEFWVFSFVG